MELKDILGAVSALGVGAIAREIWARYREKKQQQTTVETTVITTRSDYDKKLLEIATTMTEAIMKDLRGEVATLRAEVETLRGKLDEKEREIATLRAELEAHERRES